MDDNQYGNLLKKVVFEDSDKRYADLKLKLRYDGLTQKQFFQNIITGYLSGDTRIIEFITELKYIIAKQGKAKISKSQSLRQKGQNIKQMYNLDEKQKQDIFDIIAEEFPDL